METSDKIAEKAGELFLRYGIKSVTMGDIASNLGVAKKTVYKFFDNKDALIANFIIRETTNNRNSCNILATTDNDPLIKLFLTMLYIQKFYCRLNSSVTNVLEKYYHKSYLILKQHKEEFLFETIKNHIQEGIAQLLYQDNFNVVTMSKFFLESMSTISDNRVFSPADFDANDQEDILGHMISGIATIAGLNRINGYKYQHRFTPIAQTLRQAYWED